MNISIILGTGREGRNSENVAKYVEGIVKAAGHVTEILDPRNYGFLFTDRDTSRGDEYRKKIKESDAFIIVSPEYNHGYPGDLKIMMDTAYEEYFHKPVGICGVSIGPFGGARMVEQLKPVMVEFHMIPVRESVYFGSVGELFNDEGKIKDAAYDERVKKMLEEVIQYVGCAKG